MQSIGPTTATGGDDGHPTFSGLAAGDVFRFSDSWNADCLWIKTDNPEFDAACLEDGELISVFGDPFVVPIACKVTPLEAS